MLRKLLSDTAATIALTVFCLFGAYAVVAQDSDPATPGLPEVPPATTVSEPSSRYKIGLTLTNPEDLRVKEGELVVAGQTILADRVRDRQRLLAQRQILALQLEKLQLSLIPNVELRPIRALPPESFLAEAAKVQRAETALDVAQQEYDAQIRKMDLLKTLPVGDLPDATMPHEEAKLQQLERVLQQARSEVNLAQAELAKARTERSILESSREAELARYELERNRQAQITEQQERERSYQIAQVQARLGELDQQLEQLAIVKAPYTGTIQRIKWEGQNDQQIKVELAMAVGRDASRPVVPSPSVPVSPVPTGRPASSPSPLPSPTGGPTRPVPVPVPPQFQPPPPPPR